MLIDVLCFLPHIVHIVFYFSSFFSFRFSSFLALFLPSDIFLFFLFYPYFLFLSWFIFSFNASSLSFYSLIHYSLYSASTQTRNMSAKTILSSKQTHPAKSAVEFVYWLQQCYVSVCMPVAVFVVRDINPLIKVR